MGGITKLGNCVKCGLDVYVDNVHGAPTNGNILLQNCTKGGDCEVKCANYLSTDESEE